ncbi:UNVERIFIED_CONTAM: hypothetical protein Sindi_2862600, partial [Sesamum indicum]
MEDRIVASNTESFTIFRSCLRVEDISEVRSKFVIPGELVIQGVHLVQGLSVLVGAQILEYNRWFLYLGYEPGEALLTAQFHSFMLKKASPACFILPPRGMLSSFHLIPPSKSG